MLLTPCLPETPVSHSLRTAVEQLQDYISFVTLITIVAKRRRLYFTLHDFM